MKKPSSKKSLWISAEKKRGRYSVLITGEGWDAPSLGRLFDVIQSVADERTFVVFPVIRELENPELMKVLDERLKAVKDGTAETVPWDEVMKKLRARVKKTRKNPNPHKRS